MTHPVDPFNDQTAAKCQEIKGRLSLSPLRIAVLGPSLEDSDSPGTRKRMQIYDSLKTDGHNPFFPEDEIDNSNPFQTWLEEERLMLSASDVDLVIILNTEDSAGALMEIANFVSVPEINIKTAVLFPNRHYKPDEGLPGNTVQAYFTRFPYTDEQMETCRLVSECRRWAYDRQNGIWPGLSSQSF